MIEAYIVFPSRFAMTLLALIAFLPGMRIIAPVTGHARHIEPDFAGRLDVTRSTSLTRMSPAQWKARLARVIKAGLPPVTFVVAVLAGHTVAPLVRTRVLGAMARKTISRQPHLPRRLHVTRAALNSGMAPPQRKTRARMVKPGRTPPDGAVTLSAVRPQTPMVRVIRLVAVYATRRRSVVSLAGVTRHAACCEMRALERKACIGVIEANLPPVLIGVTTAASNAQPASVWLVRPMTIDACARSLTKLATRDVA